MHEKLSINTDHFNNEEAKMAYVFGRTEHKAKKHLFTRYNYRTTTPFQSAAEMIRMLGTIYKDPNRKRHARLEYDKLVMEPSDAIHEFTTTFILLAEEAGTPEDALFYGYYDKLTYLLRDKLAPLLPTFQGSLTLLSDAAIQLDAEVTHNSVTRKERAERKIGKQASVVRNTPVPPQTLSYEKKAHFPMSPAIQRKKDDTIPTCYTCGEVGHKSPDCPKKKRSEMKDIEMSVYKEKKMDSEASSEDSGNEDA
jgi:hypothetical protein